MFFVLFGLSNDSNEKTVGKGAREKRSVGFLGLPLFNFRAALSLSLRTTNLEYTNKLPASHSTILLVSATCGHNV